MCFPHFFSGAWIITEGLAEGVSQLVGEAVQDNIYAGGKKVIALGIAPWGCIANRKSLKNEASTKQ